MPGTAKFLLSTRSKRLWMDSIQVKVGWSLLLLVILAIPTFLILVHNRTLIFYFLIYPPTVAFGLYLRYRGYEYLSSFVIVLAIYGVVAWLAWLAGFDRVTNLSFWIIALLPWVMFTRAQRTGLALLTLLPVLFSFIVQYLPLYDTPLLPAERDFILQILRISVAVGAFSCVYFLREEYHEAERLRILENEFYRNTLNAMPLPIIIKDGITLDYVFFNQAAQLTYDLRPGAPNTNVTTFSESCAAAVSRLDREVMRSVAYHIEPDENLVHQTGLHWHFRTYRIPLELRSSGRRLLINVSEDLRALDHVMRKTQNDNEVLDHLYRLIAPVLFRFDISSEKIALIEPGKTERATEALSEELAKYLTYYLSHNHATATSNTGYHRFPLGNRVFDLFFAYSIGTDELTGVVIEGAQGSQTGPRPPLN